MDGYEMSGRNLKEEPFLNADGMDTYEGPEHAIGAPRHIRDSEWERKQRNREYRVAARREKRNRKADEKKQRKLNATILRRMTRNPDKYNKNAERNRLRDIEGERRRIYQEAVRQAQRLAAIHDPSGAMFNVSPVVKQEDGTVISQDTLRRREERIQEKASAERAAQGGTADTLDIIKTEIDSDKVFTVMKSACNTLQDEVNPDRLIHIEGAKPQSVPSRSSKTQQRKRAALVPKPAPPKPLIPEGVTLPEGEEDWLALWDLSDDQLERRVIREKKRKAAERKALRVKQQSGKAERRAARDEKRKVYREMKLTWKAIKEEQTREKTRLRAIEDEESKKIAVDINDLERKAALDFCATLGFTLDNTPGVEEIKPRALGMKGAEVDFDAIEIGERQSDVKPKQGFKRINLGDAPTLTQAQYVPTGQHGENADADEYIKLDIGEGQDFETLSYNHKLRRKLRRAIDNAQIQKEMLVRQRAIDHYQEKGDEHPAVLRTPYKPVNIKGQRILDNGVFETAKQERVRARMELAEFNTQMRVLRKQAKDAAIYAGLRKHAELSGKISPSELSVKEEIDDGTREARSADLASVIGGAMTPGAYGDIGLGMKRSGSASDDSSSSDSDDHTDQESVASSPSRDCSDSDSMSSDSEASPRKRQKKACSGEDIIPNNEQSKSTNSDRQAMIDAESAKTVSAVKEKGNKADQPGSLKEVNVNGDRRLQRRGMGKGANAVSNWNVNGLPGDKARKGKFLRLLGAEKFRVDGGVENAVHTGDIAQVNADLQKQYEYGIAHRKDSRRQGLDL